MQESSSRREAHSHVHGSRRRSPRGRGSRILKAASPVWHSYPQLLDRRWSPLAVILATASLLVASGCAGGVSGVQPGLIATPSLVSLANVAVGKTKTQTVTLTNTSDAPLTVNRATMSGTGFKSIGLRLPVSLSSGQSFSFEVQFAPNSAGSTSGNLSLVTDAPQVSVNVTLSGSGVPIGPSSTPSFVTVAVTPSSATVLAGASFQLAATVSGTSNTAVTWAVNGIKGARR